MPEYDVYELKTAEEIDATFAKTFGLSAIQWAQAYDQDAVTDFLEGFSGERKVWSWSITLRNWNRGNGSDYMCEVSSKHQHGDKKLGCKGYGFSDYACWGLMKAAIAWDQQRRKEKRERVQIKRSKAHE